MQRRDFISLALGGAAVAGSGAMVSCSGDGEHGSGLQAFRSLETVYDANGKRKIPWQNWSGYLHSYPDKRITPSDEAELAQILQTAASPIRPAGASHSFTPLVPTDGSLLSLRKFSGMSSYDPKAMTATFGAGTRIGSVGAPLDAVGQALPNMPDIDEQTLAGAMATATHGSGHSLPALHGQVESLRLVAVNGEVIDCSNTRNSEVFNAALVSMGSLGVVTQYTLKNMASYKLKRKTWIAPFDEFVDGFADMVKQYHSLEFYYIPYCDYVLAVGMTMTDDPVSPRTEDGDNDAVMELKLLRDSLGWWPGLRRWVANRAVKSETLQENVDTWYKIYPSERAVRFNEMEYHLPREAMAEALRRVRQTIEGNNLPIFFPVEVRAVAQDDAWLSPFYQRESCSIAAHRIFSEDPMDYFPLIEPIYQDYEGRPHWAKMNTMTKETFAARYPRWQDFSQVRAQLDPQGKMLNPYLKSLFL